MDDRPPEAILADVSPALQRIAEELRGIIRATLPDAVERVRPRWRVIGYDVPVGKRTAYVAWVWPQPEHCHLGFQQGWAMHDPHGRLEGVGVTKQVRWLTFDAGDVIDHALCRDLLLEAAAVGRMTKAERVVRAADLDDGRPPELD